MKINHSLTLDPYSEKIGKLFMEAYRRGEIQGLQYRGSSRGVIVKWTEEVSIEELSELLNGAKND